MRRGTVVIMVGLLVLLGGCGAPPPAAAPGIEGDWHGTVAVPGSALAFGMHLAGDGTGTITIPAQNLAGSKVADVSVTGTAVAMKLPDIPGDPSFAGTLSADGATIEGTFTQNGATIPFTMTRGALPAAARPQEPKPPYPYPSTDVTFPSGAITLAGTLTEPQGNGPFPAVVMITGSGAQDRDETLAGHKPFLLIADTLTRAGFAVLRTDDRGVGGSGGDLNTATYDDLAGDALAGVAFLRGRPEIDQAKIGLFGHSEGGYLAPLAADRSNGQVHAVVMMAGPAVSGEDVLVEQNKLIFQLSGSPQAQVDAQVDYLHQLATLLRAGQGDAAKDLVRKRVEAQSAGLPAGQQPSPTMVDGLAAQYTSPNFASFMLYDPAPALSALSVPVLAFYGSKDVQVPATQSVPAAQKLLAGKPGVTVTTLPGLNHLMQPAQTGSPDEYQNIETTVDPSALNLVTSWLTQNLR